VTNHRSFLLWSGSFTRVNCHAESTIVRFRCNGKNAPSSDPAHLEHVFDLSTSSWKTWIKAVETLIPRRCGRHPFPDVPSCDPRRENLGGTPPRPSICIILTYPLYVQLNREVIEHAHP
jgi:hypothetical protein